MHDSLKKQIGKTKASIMAGKPDLATRDIDTLVALLKKHPPSQDERDHVEERLAELRSIAEAALTGARSAAEQVQAIIQAARSLQTYDNRGQLNIAAVTSARPRRF